MRAPRGEARAAQQDVSARPEYAFPPRAFRVSFSQKWSSEADMNMEFIVAALMVIVALVFVGIAMHAARNPKGRD